jgi:hypothetical protein
MCGGPGSAILANDLNWLDYRMAPKGNLIPSVMNSSVEGLLTIST